MQTPHAMFATDSMAEVVDAMTKHNWDHLFIVDEEGAPLGRLHAVDLLKMVSRKLSPGGIWRIGLITLWRLLAKEMLPSFFVQLLTKP